MSECREASYLQYAINTKYAFQQRNPYMHMDYLNTEKPATERKNRKRTKPNKKKKGFNFV